MGNDYESIAEYLEQRYSSSSQKKFPWKIEKEKFQ